MKVGDLVQYIRDMPTSFVEFSNGLKCNDIGIIIDELRNGTTVKVKWFKNDQEFWMGRGHLEVINGRQETESS